MKAVLSFVLIIILFTSCTYYKPCSFQVTNTYPNNTVLVGNATATSKIVYVLGIGKTDHRLPITQQVKDKLLSTYKLRSNQTLTNITLDYTTTRWFLGYTDRAIINADIVQLLKPGEVYVPNDSLFIFGSKEVNGKKVNLYFQRYNYKLNEEVLVTGFTHSSNKIIELYDDELLVEFANYLNYHTSESELPNFTKKVIPYSQISKKQK